MTKTKTTDLLIVLTQKTYLAKKLISFFVKHKLFEFLRERNIDSRDIDQEDLYKAGMENVKDNIEFYFDKTYTCESVIKELFIRGMDNYIRNKKPSHY